MKNFMLNTNIIFHFLTSLTNEIWNFLFILMFIKQVKKWKFCEYVTIIHEIIYIFFQKSFRLFFFKIPCKQSSYHLQNAKICVLWVSANFSWTVSWFFECQSKSLVASFCYEFIVVTENRLRNFFLQNCPLMNIIIFYAEIVYEKKADLQSFFVRVKGVAKSTFQVKISMQKLVIFQTQVFLQRV